MAKEERTIGLRELRQRAAEQKKKEIAECRATKASLENTGKQEQEKREAEIKNKLKQKELARKKRGDDLKKKLKQGNEPEELLAKPKPKAKLEPEGNEGKTPRQLAQDRVKQKLKKEAEQKARQEAEKIEELAIQQRSENKEKYTAIKGVIAAKQRIQIEKLLKQTTELINKKSYQEAGDLLLKHPKLFDNHNLKIFFQKNIPNLANFLASAASYNKEFFKLAIAAISADILNKVIISSIFLKQITSHKDEEIEKLLIDAPRNLLPKLLQELLEIEAVYNGEYRSQLIKDIQNKVVDKIIDQSLAKSLSFEMLMKMKGKNEKTLLHLIIKKDIASIFSLINELPDELLPNLLVEIRSKSLVECLATGLFWASQRYTEIFEQIIQKLQDESLFDLLQIMDKDGNTPLYLAASKNQSEIIESIINKISAESLPALLQIPAGWAGDTPLYWVLKQKQDSTIKLIIDKTPTWSLPALLQIRDKNGDTILNYMLEKGKSELIESIINSTPAESLPGLLQIQDKNGDTILNYMLEKGKSELIESIINRTPAESLPALLQIQDKNGDTPLHSAVKGDKLEIIELIINNIPDELLSDLLKIGDNRGDTPLHLAVIYSRVEIVKLLMDNTPKESLPGLLQMQNKNGNTILHLVALGNNVKYIALIIDRTPTEQLHTLLKIRDKEGNTPLRLAAKGNNVKYIELIINNISDESLLDLLKIEDTEGYTPLHFAIEQAQHSTIKLIIDKISPESLPTFLSELSRIAIGMSAYALNMLEEALNYSIHSEVKFFNINAIGIDGERIIDIVQKLYVHTQKPSVLKLINDLRIAGSVEPREEIQIQSKKAIEENINLTKLDSSGENKEITRKVLDKLNGYNLSEAQIDDNIDWFKQKDFDGWANTSWGWRDAGERLSIPEVIDRLSGMRNVNDRLGVNWDFKKVLATIIHIARTSNDEAMTYLLIHTLSDLKMCDLGKLMNLVYVAQSKFIQDMEAAQKPIDFSDDEISFLFHNTLYGLKYKLGGDTNKIAEAIKTWIFELTDKEIARDTPEKWCFTTANIHGLFNSGLIELINYKNLNCDSSHFISLQNNLIKTMINNIQSPKAVPDKIINEWREFYIHSKNLYFQQEFDKIAEAPDTMEDAFGNFAFSHQSYYGDLKGIDPNVFAKFYKKLLDQGDVYAEQFIKIAKGDGFLDTDAIESMKVRAQDPSLFDDDLAHAMQLSMPYNTKGEEEEFKEPPPSEEPELAGDIPPENLD